MKWDPAIGSDGDPLERWRGDFGRAYIQRNQATAEAIAEAATVFERILYVSGIGTEIGTILEVGANTGIKLLGLRRLLGNSVRLAAVEPNPLACEQLRKNKILVVEGQACNIPLADRTFELVFTSGVLVHIPPDQLPVAMREIARVARRYVLCSEYFSHRPVEIPYHGQTHMLWKRDFGLAYLQHCPELRVHNYGFLWQVEFPYSDNLNWWMFKRV